MSDAVSATALDAEKALVGWVLCGRGADYDALASVVEPDDFALPLHSEMWSAAAVLVASGIEPDPNTVRVQITQQSPGFKFNPFDVVDVVSYAPAAQEGGAWYAQQVVEFAERRRIVRAATQIRVHAEQAETVSALRDLARAELETALAKTSVRTGPKPMAEVFTEVYDATTQAAAAGPSLGSGWPDLDRLIGFAPGRLVVIGARPAVGKSLIGTNLARHFAEVHQHAVLIASLEMSTLEVGQRVTADVAGINVTRLADGMLEAAEMSRLDESASRITDLSIFTHDDASQTVAGIRAAVRAVKRTRPDLALVVVDYLQLMETAGKAGNRAEAIGQMSRGLKILAREEYVCVVAMAQLNRNATRPDEPPRMSDLRESGAIEADANIVVLLWRPNEEFNHQVQAIVEKNRHGPRGTADLQVWGHYARITGHGSER